MVDISSDAAVVLFLLMWTFSSSNHSISRSWYCREEDAQQQGVDWKQGTQSTRKRDTRRHGDRKIGCLVQIKAHDGSAFCFGDSSGQVVDCNLQRGHWMRRTRRRDESITMVDEAWLLSAVGCRLSAVGFR
ncbi:expressed unknown protein [Seminavis robusta]|uniref:Secreted protein n=1 Tax=Seminavis robusta TaxID=568900 RepID=A0A9N8EN40_9STRA|nr:expressed unknown protein [Seminavis robusta]|eukprot:Sro1205_g252320.1 n/a (131) ;mRNA; r:30136-30690